MTIGEIEREVWQRELDMLKQRPKGAGPYHKRELAAEIIRWRHILRLKTAQLEHASIATVTVRVDDELLWSPSWAIKVPGAAWTPGHPPRDIKKAPQAEA